MFSQFIPHLISRIVKIVLSYISWQVNVAFVKSPLSVFLSANLLILILCVML